jgi:hypothetical protein
MAGTRIRLDTAPVRLTFHTIGVKIRKPISSSCFQAGRLALARVRSRITNHVILTSYDSLVRSESELLISSPGLDGRLPGKICAKLLIFI